MTVLTYLAKFHEYQLKFNSFTFFLSNRGTLSLRWASIDPTLQTANLQPWDDGQQLYLQKHQMFQKTSHDLYEDEPKITFNLQHLLRKGGF